MVPIDDQDPPERERLQGTYPLVRWAKFVLGKGVEFVKKTLSLVEPVEDTDSVLLLVNLFVVKILSLSEVYFQ